MAMKPRKQSLRKRLSLTAVSGGALEPSRSKKMNAYGPSHIIRSSKRKQMGYRHSMLIS